MRTKNIVNKLITGLIFCTAWIIQIPAAPCTTVQAHAWFATDVVVATDGKLADVYMNGRKLPKRKVKLITTHDGVTVVDLWVHTHPGDWLVFHVVCPKSLMQRRGIAVAGRWRGNGVFLSEEQTLQWCAISNAGQAPAFIATRDYLRKSSAVIPQYPSHHCFTMVAQHTNFGDGEVIWASGNPLEAWIKCLIPRHPTPPTGIPDNTGQSTPSAAKPQLSAAEPIAGGTYTLTNAYSRLMLNDPGDSNKPDTAIDQAKADGGKHQEWEFIYQGRGVYTIENKFSELYLSGPESDPQPGDLLRQEFRNQGASQHWKLQRQGKGFLCINAASGLTMDDYGHEVKSGTAVDLWSVHHVHIIGNQDWIFHKVRGTQAGIKSQNVMMPVVRHTVPILAFTDPLAEKALHKYQAKINIEHEIYQKACAQAARTCEAALHRALVTAITMNRPGETRKLTIILTAMQQPMYHPVVATTFTIRSAQHA